MPNALQITRRLDKIFVEPERPGAQYVVTNAQGTLFEYSGGWGDISRHEPVRLTTIMMLHSLTKVFTGIAILQLAEQNKLGLDDPADRYLDGLPYGPEVTICRLLAQTSGLPHPLPLKWIHLPDEADTYDDDAALRAVVAAHPVLTFPPGERFGYSNISYWILGRIVEIVSGKSYGDYIRSEIGERLEPPVQDIYTRLPNGAELAFGYIAAGTPFELQKEALFDPRIFGDYFRYYLRIEPYYCNGSGCCGLFGTARAIAVLLMDLLGAKSRLLNSLSKSLLLQRQQTADGLAIPMTLGWHIGEIDGMPYFFKEGNGAGFHSEMRIYPERGIGSVIIANEMGYDVRSLLNRFDPLFS